MVFAELVFVAWDPDEPMGDAAEGEVAVVIEQPLESRLSEQGVVTLSSSSAAVTRQQRELC